MLAELTGTLAQLQTPAFILDGFGDLLALNLSFTAVYHLETSQLQAPQLLSQYNLNRFLFSPEFDAQRSRLEESQFDFARQTILLFKLWTLKLRNHWYFQRLLPELNRYPSFREHWQSPSFQNEDILIQYTHFTLKHPELGKLKFLSVPIQAISTQGDLYLFSLQPLEAQTAEVCRQLARELGTEPLPLASWPKPSSPTGPLNSF